MKRLLIVTLLIATAWTARADRNPYTRNVAVVIYEDAEPLDWTGPFEVWNDAASFGRINNEPPFRVYTVSKTTATLSSQGLKVVPDYSIENAPQPDILIIPGGNSSHVSDDPAFMAWVKAAAEKAEITQTICTGAFVMAKTGLLDNLEITTWYGAIDYLQKAFPKVTVKNGRRFVDNGRFVTTAGISAGIDGSLHLVARLLGRRVADEVARYMEYHWTPESYLSTRYQYLNPSTNDRGRLEQTGKLRREEKDYRAAVTIYQDLLAGHEADGDLWNALGTSYQSLDEHDKAGEAFVHAAATQQERESGFLLYRAAVEFARAHDDERAMALLQKAWNAGFHDGDAIRGEPALAHLLEDGRLKAIIATAAPAAAK